MSTDNTNNTLSNTLSTLIQTLTDLKAALDRPQLEKAPDLSEYVKRDELTDTVDDAVRDAMRDSDNVSRVAQAVWDDVDYRDLAREIEDHLDVEDKVSDGVANWFDNNFSPSDYDLATQDYVDSRVSDAVDEKLDTGTIVERVKANMGDAVRQIVREELRKILNLDHQTRKTLGHTRNPKIAPHVRKG